MEDLLRRNLAMQLRISASIEAVVEAMHVADAALTRLNHLASAAGSSAASLYPQPPFTLPRVPPFFIDAEFQIPPLNSDAASTEYSHIKYLNKNPAFIAPKRLYQEVERENKRILSRNGRDQQPSPTDPRIQSNLNGINWSTVATSIPGKSAMDCKIHWTVHMHPSINKSPFSKIEVESLERIVSQRVNQELDLDWDSIAQELGNDRLAWQCFRIYQKYINAASQSWTPEEDAKLTSLVATHGLGNWSRIARSMETRSRTQCIVRWRQNLRPGIARGRFTPEEDEKLVAAVQEFGERSWAKVANAVGTRNDVQCRERWLNVLNPDLRKGVSFTREENTQLLELVQVHGERWGKVAKALRTRTAKQCQKQFSLLKLRDQDAEGPQE